MKAGQPLAEMDGSILSAQLDQQTAAARRSRRPPPTSAAREAARVADLDNQGVMAEEQRCRPAASPPPAPRPAPTPRPPRSREMQTRLDHMVLRAPVSGLVLQRNVNLGDISGGGANAVVRDGRRRRDRAATPTSPRPISPRCSRACKATVTLADVGTADGVVRLVSPRVDANTRLGKVRISLPVRADIRAGGYARASFTDLVARRAGAAGDRGPLRRQRRLGDGGRAPTARSSQVPVRTGDRGGGYVELLSGPAAGLGGGGEGGFPDPRRRLCEAVDSVDEGRRAMITSQPAAHLGLGDPQPDAGRGAVHRAGDRRPALLLHACRSRTTRTSSSRW